MSDLDKDIEELKAYLYSSETFQEYFALKEAIESDEELERQRKAIARASQNADPHYESLKNAYESNPLVSNYYALREEIDSLLLEIKEYLEDK
ncbi:MAG: YlbF family regulator [Coprobacillus sp.]|nr:YlbF family regulator [Coprobacillus sp.]